MPRMLRRAAVLGATAHVASNRGAARANAQNAQQAAAQPQYDQAPVPDAPPLDIYAELTQLKGLLDAGVLTQAEFDAQKQKLLG